MYDVYDVQCPLLIFEPDPERMAWFQENTPAEFPIWACEAPEQAYGLLTHSRAYVWAGVCLPTTWPEGNPEEWAQWLKVVLQIRDTLEPWTPVLLYGEPSDRFESEIRSFGAGYPPSQWYHASSSELAEGSCYSGWLAKCRQEYSLMASMMGVRYAMLREEYDWEPEVRFRDVRPAEVLAHYAHSNSVLFVGDNRPLWKLSRNWLPDGFSTYGFTAGANETPCASLAVNPSAVRA